VQADVFRNVRERVSAKEAFNLYGITVNARGLALCPFHADTRPSVSFKGDRFKCFACDVSGDSIDFVSKYFGISGTEAAKKIDTDFSLGLFNSERACKEDRSQLAQIAAAHEAFEIWRDTMIRKLNSVYRVAHLAIKRGKPFTAKEALAIQRQAAAEYYSDLLEAGTPEDQAQIYRERGEILKWIEKILKD
jgi:hypothetical protein